jgi:hypothetical protein
MLTKLCDLKWFQRRNRPPCLVGSVGGFQLLLVGRHKPAPGEPDFTLLIGRHPADSERRALPPVWDDVRKCWIGPREPDYPGGPRTDPPGENDDEGQFVDGGKGGHATPPDA